MNKDELKEKLDAHALWLKTRNTNDVQGECADLRGADLCSADLRNTDLRNADLRDTNLRSADLRDTNLRNADLRGADLCNANLRDTNLRNADLRGADLCCADLRGADLCSADLRGADLDYSAWPFWCMSLSPKIDKRISAQLLYHALRAMQSCADEPDVAAVLSSEPCLRLANQFHQVGECGRIEPPQEGGAK